MLLLLFSLVYYYHLVSFQSSNFNSVQHLEQATCREQNSSTINYAKVVQDNAMLSRELRRQGRTSEFIHRVDISSLIDRHIRIPSHKNISRPLFLLNVIKSVPTAWLLYTTESDYSQARCFYCLTNVTYWVSNPVPTKPTKNFSF